jgi:hypothetical protein
VADVVLKDDLRQFMTLERSRSDWNHFFAIF